MSICDVYIANLDDPDFDWDNLGPEGKCPVRRSPFFPPMATHRPFFEVLHRIQDGSWDGQQLDWGASGAKLYAPQIRAFIDEIYGTEPDGGAHYEGFQHLKTWLLELRAFVATLDDAKQYVIVASEL